MLSLMILHRYKVVLVLNVVFLFGILNKSLTRIHLTNDRNETKFIRQLHLCSEDFQRTLDLTLFNRTLILYEVEWFSKTFLNILSVIVESPSHPMEFIGNFLSEFQRFYSVQCRYKNSIVSARLKYYQMHEYDRTVLIQCDTNEIDENENSFVELRLIELKRKIIHSIDIHLCWSNDRRVTIGHCHKALFDRIPFDLIEQWLNYHISIGIELFYIYDRTLTYRNELEAFIQQGYVVYFPFPLPNEFAQRDHFNWIDQFVGKMHCLLRIRSTFDWLGTWDIDEYLNFFDDQTPIYSPQCNEKNRCSSMLNEYLTMNFENYSNIIIYATNFLTKRSLTSSNRPIVVEEYQHRLTTWNDRVKYLVRPMDVEMINIHYALYIRSNRTYESHVRSPDDVSRRDSRSLIRLNHYPSAQKIRDRVFLSLQRGFIKYKFDPLLSNVFFKLQTTKMSDDQSRKAKAIISTSLIRR